MVVWWEVLKIFISVQNVIDAAPVEYRQIKTGEKENAGEYVTDTGLVVPSIALSLRDRLMAAAEARGFSRERITELVNKVPVLKFLIEKMYIPHVLFVWIKFIDSKDRMYCTVQWAQTAREVLFFNSIS